MVDFEKQALASAPYAPKIWKRYVDDTFTILSRDKVDSFLQHEQSATDDPLYCRDWGRQLDTIPFLDTSVTKDSDRYFSISVYRKATRTDQYLAYDSHHTQSVKRGSVKYLYDLSKQLITKPTMISRDERHLSSLFVSNGYTFSCVEWVTKTKKRMSPKERAP